MRIIYPLADFNEGWDCDNNPEIILMRQQGDEYECEIEESSWHAGSAVTKPKLNHHDQ